MNDRKQLETRKAELTPEQQALFRKRMEASGISSEAKPIPAADSERPIPLSYGQERLWFVAQLDGADTANHRPANFHIRGPLRIETLQQAFDEIVRRHSILRARLPLAAGIPEQRIEQDLSFPLSVTELTDVPVDRRIERARELTEEEGRLPFDLARGPLVRAGLLRLHAEEHIFLVTFHHAIFDGWSEHVFQSELKTLYDAYLKGMNSPLPELKAQYSGFSSMQRSHLQGPRYERCLSFWLDTLRDAPAVLELPTDRPRPAQLLNEGEEYSFLLSEELREELKKVGASEGATLYMTLLAAFNVLLYRYTGQTDLVIGSPVAGRRHIDTEPLIGLFINMLPLRSDLSGNPGFRILLQRVRETVLQAFDHQDLPFEKLVEVLAPPRMINYTPIFQIFFQLRNLPRSDPNFEGITLSPFRVPLGISAFDLSVDMEEVEEGLFCRIEFDTGLFDRDTIERMFGHFRSLLKGIAEDPDVPVSRLPLMSADQRRDIAENWRSAEFEYPVDSVIHELFRSQAARTPDEVAVFTRTTTHSFSDVDRMSDDLAGLLVEKGVAVGSIVGILMPRSADLVVGILSVLKAGAIYLPLDPEYPADRIRFMIENSDVQVVVTDSRASLPDEVSGVTTLTMREGPEKPAEDPVSAEHSSRRTDAMYLLYTSGSTGTPKGVIGTHCGAINRLHWMWRAYPFAPGEVCCQTTSASFVDSVWELFGPLLRGIPSVSIPDEEVKDPHRLVKRLCDSGVTRIVVVPSLLASLLKTFENLGALVPRLLFWVSSGEALSPDLVRRFHKAVPGGRLINLYGSSEVAADVACYETSPDDNVAAVPIGRPIDNTRLYVLDANAELVPPGVPGELYVGGTCLARGYLGRDDLTAERFLADPFVPGAGLRMFRTGDRVRWRDNRDLEFLGRADRQVSLRGFRIELGEIESLLRDDPVVDDAAVAMEGHAGFERLIAYIVSRGAGKDEEALRAALARQLPAYMIPSAFVFIKCLPLTPNGKLDRAALPRPSASLHHDGMESGKPASELERKLADLWAENLGLDRIGVHDNYFENGGHSLLAVQLFTAIENVLHTRLPLGSLFQAPTIRELAGTFPESDARQTETLIELIREGGVGAPLFLVHPRGGGLFRYSILATKINPSHAVFGIHPVGLDGKSPCLNSVEEMAARYVAEVRQIQPTGPILLGGYSFGGRIVFEMARQFRASGRSVALLAMFDTYGPDFWSNTSNLRAGICRQLYRGKEIMYRYRLRPSGQRLRFLIDRVSTVLRRRGINFLPRFEPDLPESLQRVVDANVAAHRNYVPSAYHGDVTLFVAKSRLFGMPFESTLGWSRVVKGDIRIREIDGDHLMLLEESNVQSLADQLNQELLELSAEFPQN